MLRREFLRTASASALAGVCAWNVLDGANLFAEEAKQELPKNVTLRGSYELSRRTIVNDKRANVAFMGGSITEMEGYRPMVCEYLQKKFPETEFNFVAAGISSTCSDVGAYRLESDVLSKLDNKVDLFFVEFAVNDDQDGMFDLQHSIRGMEGVIRHIKTACPYVNIVMTFFVNENLMQKYREGSVATSIQAHRQVAERYGVSTIDLAKEIQERIDSGKITWEEFGGVHPAPRGNRICADMIAALLDKAWSAPDNADVPAMPDPIDPNSYCSGAFRGFDGVDLSSGFSVVTPDWSKIPGGFRDRFAGIPCLCADKPGSMTTFEFEGNALALYVLAGPDAGMLEAKIDDGEWKKIDVYHPYSAGLHYPRAVTIADALERGKHKATLRVCADMNLMSKGFAVRAMQICVNK